jgi:hypothetical protein
MDISYCPSQAVESAPYIVKRYVELATLSCSYQNILKLRTLSCIMYVLVQAASRPLQLLK